MPRTALHVSPHPDDEVLGAGATLMELRDGGWRVVNLACGLGRPSDWERRRTELDRAIDVMRIEGVVAEPPVAMSGTDDLGAAQDRVAGLVIAEVGRLGAELIISPHPEDGHHAHRMVGRAVAAAAAGLPEGPTRWWAWSLWRDVPEPNRYVPYGEARLRELLWAMRQHAGEVHRNRYDELIPARGRTQAILGGEKVFGFGSARVWPEPYADLFEEHERSGGKWVRGAPASGIGM